MSVAKRRKVMLASIICAVAVFVASTIAAGANLSGYERLKAAGFKLVEEMNDAGGAYSNGMFWLEGALFVNDVETMGWSMTYIRDGEREFTRSATYLSLPVPDGAEGPGDAFFYGGIFDDEVVIYSDESVVYRWYGEGYFSERANYGWRDYRIMPDREEYAMTPAEKRFLEALADALVGDTRSYFISSGNSVSISLSGNQIPQLAQYAVAAFAERANEDLYDYDYDYDYDFDFGFDFERGGGGSGSDSQTIGADARISYGMMEMTFDGADNISSADIAIEIVSTVNGAPKPIRFEASFRSANVGSTVIAKPDGNMQGAPKLPAYSDGGAGEITYPYGGAALALALAAPKAGGE